MSEDWLAVVIAFGLIVLAAIAAAGSNSELQGLLHAGGKPTIRRSAEGQFFNAANRSARSLMPNSIRRSITNAPGSRKPR